MYIYIYMFRCYYFIIFHNIFVRYNEFARTYHQFHLRRDHGSESSEHGGYADQGHAQFGGEHLRREHVNGVERYGDGVFAGQKQYYPQPIVL